MPRHVSHSSTVRQPFQSAHADHFIAGRCLSHFYVFSSSVGQIHFERLPPGSMLSLTWRRLPFGHSLWGLLFLVWLCCLGAFICYYCSLSLVAFSNSHTLLQEDGRTDTDCALKRIFLALTSAPSTLPLCNP